MAAWLEVKLLSANYGPQESSAIYLGALYLFFPLGSVPFVGFRANGARDISGEALYPKLARLLHVLPD